MLRFIAVADRKMDDTEMEGVVRFLSAFGATDLGEAGDLVSQFRALRSDEITAEDAANLLLRESNDLVPHVLNAAQLLAEVDGCVTPKERERLEWMSRKLGSTLVQAHS